MKKENRHINYMKDIQKNLLNVLDYATQYEKLLHKEQEGKQIDKRQLELEMRGIERSFEIAGEAANRVSIDIQEKYPNIAWHAMTKLRNVISYEYDGIREKVLLDTAKEDIPSTLLTGMDKR